MNGPGTLGAIHAFNPEDTLSHIEHQFGKYLLKAWTIFLRLYFQTLMNKAVKIYEHGEMT